MIQEIIDNIYIGNWQDAIQHEKQFRDIFTVAFDSKYKANHFFPLVDGPYSGNEDILNNAIYDLVKTRNKHKNKILVHCISGISRSSTVVIGYMLNKGYDVDGAIKFVKINRNIAEPTTALIVLLRNYERQLNNVTSFGDK